MARWHSVRTVFPPRRPVFRRFGSAWPISECMYRTRYRAFMVEARKWPALCPGRAGRYMYDLSAAESRLICGEVSIFAQQLSGGLDVVRRICRHKKRFFSRYLWFKNGVLFGRCSVGFSLMRRKRRKPADLLSSLDQTAPSQHVGRGNSYSTRCPRMQGQTPPLRSG